MKNRRLFYSALLGLAALGVTAGAVFAHQPEGSDSTHRADVSWRAASTWNFDQAKLDEVKARFGDHSELRERASRLRGFDFTGRFEGLDREELKARFGDRSQLREWASRFGGRDFSGRSESLDREGLKARFGDRSDLRHWSSRFGDHSLRDRWAEKR